MKWNLSKSVLLIGIFLPAEVALASVEIFTLDPRHTNVQWHVNHFGFSNLSGKWIADGVLILDKTHPENSRLRVMVQIDNLITGIPELDTQLKSKLFFDAATFPTATFISQKIETTDDITAKVEGMLTLHGVTKPITLYVILNKMGENPLSDSMTAGFSAVAEIKRSDFKISALLPELGDNVVLNIEAEAFKTGEADTVAIKMPEIEPTHLAGYGQNDETPTAAETADAASTTEPTPEPVSVAAQNKADDPLAFSAATTHQVAPKGLSAESGQKHVWSVDMSTLAQGGEEASVTPATDTGLTDAVLFGLLQTMPERPPSIPQMTAASKLTAIDAAAFREANAAYPRHVVVLAQALPTGTQPPVITQAFLKLKTLVHKAIGTGRQHPTTVPPAEIAQSSAAVIQSVPTTSAVTEAISTVRTEQQPSTHTAAVIVSGLKNTDSLGETAQPAETAAAEDQNEITAFDGTFPAESDLSVYGHRHHDTSPTIFIGHATDDTQIRELDAATFRQANAAYPAAFHTEPQQPSAPVATTIVTTLQKVAPPAPALHPDHEASAAFPADVILPEQDNAEKTAVNSPANSDSTLPDLNLTQNRLTIFVKLGTDETAIPKLNASAFRQANAAYPLAFRAEPEQSVHTATAGAFTKILKNAATSELATGEAEAQKKNDTIAATPVSPAEIDISVYGRKSHSNAGLPIRQEEDATDIPALNAAVFRQANAVYPAAFRNEPPQTVPVAATIVSSVQNTASSAPIKHAVHEASTAFPPDVVLPEQDHKTQTAAASLTETAVSLFGHSHTRDPLTVFVKHDTDYSSIREVNAVAFRQANATYRAAFHSESQQTAPVAATIVSSVQNTVSPTPAMHTVHEASAAFPPDVVLPEQDHKIQTAAASLTETAVSLFGHSHTSDPLTVFVKHDTDYSSIREVNAIAFRQANATYRAAFHSESQQTASVAATIVSSVQNTVSPTPAMHTVHEASAAFPPDVVLPELNGVTVPAHASGAATPLKTDLSLTNPGLPHNSLNIFLRHETAKTTVNELDAAAFRQANAAYPAAVHTELHQLVPAAADTVIHTVNNSALSEPSPEETGIRNQNDTATTSPVEADIAVYGRKPLHSSLSVLAGHETDALLTGLSAAAFRQTNAAYPGAFQKMALSDRVGTDTIISTLKQSIQSELTAKLAETKKPRKEPRAVTKTASAEENTASQIPPIPADIRLPIPSRQPASFPAAMSLSAAQPAIKGLDASAFRQANVGYPLAFRRQTAPASISTLADTLQQSLPSEKPAVSTQTETQITTATTEPVHAPAAPILSATESPWPSLTPDVVIPFELRVHSDTPKTAGRVLPKSAPSAPAEQQRAELSVRQRLTKAMKHLFGKNIKNAKTVVAHAKPVKTGTKPTVHLTAVPRHHSTPIRFNTQKPRSVAISINATAFLQALANQHTTSQPKLIKRAKTQTATLTHRSHHSVLVAKKQKHTPVVSARRTSSTVHAGRKKQMLNIGKNKTDKTIS